MPFSNQTSKMLTGELQKRVARRFSESMALINAYAACKDSPNHMHKRLLTGL